VINARAIDQLEALRVAEKEQALTYRGLAARAEAAGDTVLAQRFHDLHADEQHHLSRLTARVLELGGRPAPIPSVPIAIIPIDAWEEPVRRLEAAEVERYRLLLQCDLDPETRALIETIASVEAHHASDLGGKWTMA
jgi:rubrerythrin